jgi:hypothetical protein
MPINANSGRRLIEIHARELGIGFNGDILNDSIGLLAGQEQLGNMPHYGGKGISTEIVITNAQGASSNIANVSFQVTDLSGKPIAQVFNFDVWLSDAASGAGLTATTPSGGIAAVANDGIVWSVATASKAIRAQTNAAGLLVLAITDTAKTGFYPVAQNFNSGEAVIGAQLTTASYHA